MEKILNIITAKMQQAFVDAGYDASLGRVVESRMPEWDYQCNGAKRFGKEMDTVARAVVSHLDPADFEKVEVVAGFINLKISDTFLSKYVEGMRTSNDFGVEKPGTGKTVVVDYGGPNVAKPLHIGHLRSAIIGESLKRLYKFLGYNTIGDIHLGDWGLQMGLIITELQERQPDLPYFDPGFTGEYPKEPPFTLTELEEIYPSASAKKSAEKDLPEAEQVYTNKAHTATFELQNGRQGYLALWQHIMNVSLTDMRRIYNTLNVQFESWLGESDADPYIPAMVADFKARGLAVQSEGAWVVPVAEEKEKHKLNPLILVKSDGSSIYATTDLATMVQRMQDWKPDKMLYITDARQNEHFQQVFRAARKGGIVPAETELEHLGFGTMNGKDNKPFKTREGGVMRLQQLIDDMTDFVRAKVVENQIVEESEVEDTTAKIALAALKYGDLRNQPTKNYIFTIEDFAAFEGNTGPYILYAIVRVNSILAKYGAWEHLPIQVPANAKGKELMKAITKFGPALEKALKSSAPNELCAYIYELAGCINAFYHETPILKEENEEVKAGHIALIGLAKRVLEQAIDILGFSAPEKM